MNTAPRTLDVPVRGGALRVAVWEPADAGPSTPTLLAVHGVTSSHLAWQWVAEQLPDARIVAPDLRGRAGSRSVSGAAGMAAHADDLVAVLDALHLDRVLAVGHSMGAFVAVVLADRHPGRVSSLLLIDGGLPLNVPEGLDPDTIVSSILGPTAARLSMRFDGPAHYLDFWRAHPAFLSTWSAPLEDYFRYDLVPDGEEWVPSTSYETTRDDTIDLNTGHALTDALASLAHPTVLLTVPRGLQNEKPGLYDMPYLDGLLARYPTVHHRRLDDLNHYTVVMSSEGAQRVAPIIVAELAGSPAER